MAEDNKENQYVVLARKYRPQNFEDLLEDKHVDYN